MNLPTPKPAVKAAIKAVLFDLDGTLIDSAPDLAAAADLMRQRRGLPSLPYEQYRPMAGAGARGMLGVAFGIDPQHPDFVPLREEFFTNYQNALAVHTRVFDGVETLVQQLKQAGLAWGVVTNKAARFTVPLVATMPLFASASAIVSGDTTPYAKPHPQPLLEAAKQLGTPAHQCLYVGDDLRDITAGKAAGMGTVAACYGYLGAAAQPQAWGADALITQPQQVLALLQL